MACRIITTSFSFNNYTSKVTSKASSGIETSSGAVIALTGLPVPKCPGPAWHDQCNHCSPSVLSSSSFHKNGSKVLQPWPLQCRLRSLHLWVTAPEWTLCVYLQICHLIYVSTNDRMSLFFQQCSKNAFWEPMPVCINVFFLITIPKIKFWFCLFFLLY